MSISELITATTPHLHPAWVIVNGVVALVLLVFLRWPELVITLFHESGHAIASVLFGNGFHGVNLHADGSGITRGAPMSLLGAIPIYAAGYLGPGLFGFAVAWAYANNRTPLALAGLAFVAGVFAVMSRNPFAFVVSGLLAGLTGWVLLDGATLVQSLLVLLLAWLLLLGGTADAAKTVISVDLGEDHDVLESLTWFPSWLWGLGFVAVNGWCLWTGARLLLGVA